MDRVALISSAFFSLLMALNGSLSTPPVMAQKGYNPKWGVVLGSVVGLLGGLLAAVVALFAFDQLPLAGMAGAIIGAWIALRVVWSQLPDCTIDRSRIPPEQSLPDGDELVRNIQARHIRGRISLGMFFVSIIVALVALATLMWTIIDKTFGLTAVEYAVEPHVVTMNTFDIDTPFYELSDSELEATLAAEFTEVRLHYLVMRELAGASESDWDALRTQPLVDILASSDIDLSAYPDALLQTPVEQLAPQDAAQLLVANLDRRTIEQVLVLEAGRSLNQFRVIRTTGDDDNGSSDGENENERVIEVEDALSPPEIAYQLAQNVERNRLQALILQYVVQPDEPLPGTTPVWQVIKVNQYPGNIATKPFNQLDTYSAAYILVKNLDRPLVEELTLNEVGSSLLKEERPLVVVPRPLDDLSTAELASMLVNASIREDRWRALVLQEVAKLERDQWPTDESAPVEQVLGDNKYPQVLALMPFNQMDARQAVDILERNLSRLDLQELVITEVAHPALGGTPLIDLSQDQLAAVLAEYMNHQQLGETVLDMADVDDGWATVGPQPVSQVLDDAIVLPDDVNPDTPFNQLSPQQYASILVWGMDEDDLRELIVEETPTFAVGRPLESLSTTELADLLLNTIREPRLRVLVLEMADIGPALWPDAAATPVSDVLGGKTYPDTVAELPFSQLSAVQAVDILTANLDAAALQNLVFTEAREGLLEQLPESELAIVLAANTSLERLHELLVSNVLLTGPEDWPELVLEPVLSLEQATQVLMRSLDRNQFEALVVDEAGPALLAGYSDEKLIDILANNVDKARLRSLIMEHVLAVPETERQALTPLPTWQVMKAQAFADEGDVAQLPFNQLTSEQAADILLRNLTRSQLETLALEEIQAADLKDLSKQQLAAILAANSRKFRLRTLLFSNVLGANENQWPKLNQQTVSQSLKAKSYPEALADVPVGKLNQGEFALLIMMNMGRDDLEDLVFDEIIQPEVQKGWSLWDSLTKRDDIEQVAATNYPNARVEWRSWVNWEFITSPLDPRKPDATGIRPALFGSFLLIVITIVFAFPVGLGAAIYLEEYAADNWLNRIIQTNINNLAGVPSIIYGMLGLAIFVRALEHLTSGNVMGTDTANGRTILSGGLTLGLLILPLIIINAQEAIRAVPSSLRQASYGLGATKWQTIWNHVLPYSLPGILTGAILAISRAIGETAPLILIGGATFLTKDPEGPFSSFTALPLVIYRWTTLPQAEFRNAAAAAIVVLLAMLLTLNSLAIILRNRFSRRLT